MQGNPEKFKELSSMHPVGRICDPKEIGEFIAFLGSVRVGERQRQRDRERAWESPRSLLS